MRALWILPLLGVVGSLILYEMMSGSVASAPQAAQMYSMMIAAVVIPFVFVRSVEGLADGVTPKKKE